MAVKKAVKVYSEVFQDHAAAVLIGLTRHPTILKVKSAGAVSGRGSSRVEGVPVLAAVKLGRQGRVCGLVDRGCAPAGFGSSWRNPAV